MRSQLPQKQSKIPVQSQASAPRTTSRFSRRWLVALIVLLLVCGVWQQQTIADELHLVGYTPPSDIVQIADQATLTDYAKRLLYVNHPQLQDRAAFNEACSSHGEQSIVLGCYHPKDDGIFVFKVSDTRLNGVEEVTAAHEMLHAAYDRLGASEKRSIDQQLQNYYNYDLKDPRIKATIQAYTKTEPADVVNEMHSIFGTEADNLPPSLEAYYTKYFHDRKTVVDMAADYQSEFTSRKQQVDDYDSQLSQLSAQIDDNKTALSSDETALTSRKSQMDDQRAAGDISGYNANVSKYNADIDEYNQLLTTTKQLITTYNDIVAKRNAIAVQVSDLAHSIDSNFKQSQ